MKLTFEVVGKPNLAARVTGGTAKTLDRVLASAAFEIERRAKRLVPVDHGRLRASIRSGRVRLGVWKVSTNVPYAAFVEFGTLAAGRASPQPGGIPPGYRHGTRAKGPVPSAALRGWARRHGIRNVGGLARAISFGGKGRKAGVRARPFLRPATIAVRRQLSAGKFFGKVT